MNLVSCQMVMEEIKKLLDNNRRWVENCTKNDPEYFKRLAHEQKPKYLWIGCSDSRMPANLIIGLEPGEVFVHRNIANMFSIDDPNCMAVLQFAVEELKVKHIIVCGHYNCGGMEPTHLEHVKKWVSDIPAGTDPKKRVEENVLLQVSRILSTPIIQNAKKAGRVLYVHPWVYDLNTGLIKVLGQM